MKHPLEEIPGVGPRIAGVMEKLGIRQVADLVGKDPEELYRRECRLKGFEEDRCALADGGLLCRERGAESRNIKMVVLERHPLSAAERRRNQ